MFVQVFAPPRALVAALLCALAACEAASPELPDDAGLSHDAPSSLDAAADADVILDVIESDLRDDEATVDTLEDPPLTDVHDVEGVDAPDADRDAREEDGDTAAPDDANAGADADSIDTDADRTDTDTDRTDTDADDTAPDTTPDTDPPPPDPWAVPLADRPPLADVLALLSDDPTVWTVRIANDRGWPLRIQGGTLLVSLDTTLTHAAGDFDSWEGTPMSAGDGFRYLQLGDLAAGTRYKFTDRTRWVADPYSRAVLWDEFGLMSSTPPTAAHVERYFALSHGTLRPRNLHVWVPAGTPTHTLYAHDGNNLFDPSAPFGSWDLASHAPDGMLIVGIFNTPDRIDEYTPVQDRVSGTLMGGRADEYLALVDDVVRPLIRRQYGEHGPLGMMGSSLGGVISFYAVVVQPETWDFAASLSGAFTWGSRQTNNPTLIASAVALAASRTVLYLDSGGGGDTCVDADRDGVNDDDPADRDGYCATLQLRDALAAAGRTFNTDLFHWWEPGALHNEAAWAARVSRPLAIFSAMTAPSSL